MIRCCCMLVVLDAALGGCIHSQAQMGHATPHVPGIRIIKCGQGQQAGLSPRPFELRFGDKQDGTKLVLDFLDQARRSGAQYVCDLRIELRTRRAGQDVSCVTRLLPFAKGQAEVVPHQVPARTETRTVMRPVTQTVTEYTYQCQMVSHPVTRMETSYQYQYDYSSRTSRSVPVTRSVTRYEHRNECRSVPVTRTVTRYEHQIETRYIPPRLEYVSAHYTDFDLIESRPQCSASAATAAAVELPHRIVGTIYGGAR